MPDVSPVDIKRTFGTCFADVNKSQAVGKFFLKQKDNEQITDKLRVIALATIHFIEGPTNEDLTPVSQKLPHLPHLMNRIFVWVFCCAWMIFLALFVLCSIESFT